MILYTLSYGVYGAVYWWYDEIAEFRREWVRARRAYQLAARCAGPTSVEVQYEVFRCSRAALYVAIHSP